MQKLKKENLLSTTEAFFPLNRQLLDMWSIMKSPDTYHDQYSTTQTFQWPDKNFLTQH